MEFDAVLDCRGTKCGPDVERRNRDSCVEHLSHSQRFDRKRGEVVADRSMMVLKSCHRPGELTQVQHLDLIWQLCELRTELCLVRERQSGDWRKEATPESVTADVLRRYVDGGTVLLHDSDCTSYPESWHSTLGALPLLAEEFSARALTVGTVGTHGL